MAEEISSIIASARAGLQAELDAHLGVIAQHHRQTLEETREVLAAFRQIDSADSLSEALTAISHAASSIASRSALFISQDGHCAEWTTNGAEPTAERPLDLDDPSSGVVGAAMRDRVTSRGDVPAVVASNEHGRTAVAVPVLLDRVPIAVIYGDEVDASAHDDAWIERLELLAAHGATRLGFLAAVRTAQAMRWIAEGTTPVPGSTASIQQSAKRYARLLISEIKLYNEAAVRTGREQRDLLNRLQPEVDRARRLYEQRVPATLPDRAQHFDHELVQTLAGGDALLLG